MLIAAAGERRALLGELARHRRLAKVGQGELAARMGTSQSFVSRLERGLVDSQHSTEDRYAAGISDPTIKRVLTDLRRDGAIALVDGQTSGRRSAWRRRRHGADG